MIKPLHKLITKTTFGQLSLALLIICVVSGIFLVVPYNVNDAYGSISFLMLTNPAASLFRNIHYWSAQFFLLFTVIHLYDHFTRKKAIKLNMALWFRLTLGVLIIFLAMITGFILKGDADAGQAQRIFSGLVTRIPLIGEMIRQTFLGDGESLQFIYVHHIATFTIFIIIVVMEHAPTIWPRLRDFVITMTSILILSVLLHGGKRALVFRWISGNSAFDYPSGLFVDHRIVVAVSAICGTAFAEKRMVAQTVIALFHLGLFVSYCNRLFFQGSQLAMAMALEIK